MRLFQYSTDLPIRKRGRASGIEIDALEAAAVKRSTNGHDRFLDRMPL